MTEHSARSATYQNLADATIKQVTLKPLNYSGLNQIKGLLSKLPKLETFNCSQVVVDDSVIQTITELPNLT